MTNAPIIWFQYDRELRHERVKQICNFIFELSAEIRNLVGILRDSVNVFWKIEFYCQ